MSQAARIADTVSSSSGAVRSTPRTVAPQACPLGVIESVMAPKLAGRSEPDVSHRSGVDESGGATLGPPRHFGSSCYSVVFSSIVCSANRFDALPDDGRRGEILPGNRTFGAAHAIAAEAFGTAQHRCTDNWWAVLGDWHPDVATWAQLRAHAVDRQALIRTEAVNASSGSPRWAATAARDLTFPRTRRWAGIAWPDLVTALAETL